MTLGVIFFSLLDKLSAILTKSTSMSYIQLHKPPRSETDVHQKPLMFVVIL